MLLIRAKMPLSRAHTTHTEAADRHEEAKILEVMCMHEARNYNTIPGSPLLLLKRRM